MNLLACEYCGESDPPLDAPSGFHGHNECFLRYTDPTWSVVCACSGGCNPRYPDTKRRMCSGRLFPRDRLLLSVYCAIALHAKNRESSQEGNLDATSPIRPQ